MRKITKLAASVVIMTFALSAVPAQAESFRNATGLFSPSHVETFEFPTVPDYSSGGSLFAGMTLSSNLSVTSEYSGFYGVSGQSIVNFPPCCSTPSFVYFSDVQSDVGFLFVTNEGTSTFSAFLSNVLVESFSALTDTTGTNNYYGFTGISFDSLRFDSGGANNAFVLDNMQFHAAPVPEPESYAMLLAGLGLLGFLARRKKLIAA